MKTVCKLTAVLLLAVMMLGALVSCGSTFSKIKSNFEKAGYTYVNNDEEGNSTAKAITAELEEGNLNCTVHFFKTETEAGAFGISVSMPSYCMVLEFSSDKELQKALSDEENGSATLRGLIQDAQKSEYVRDNCVLVALSLTKAEEMVEIFNK